MQKLLFIISSILIFAVLNYNIYQKEKLKKGGDIVLLEIKPIHPKSFIQGNHVILNYAIEEDLNRQSLAQKKGNYIVITADINKIAKFERFYNGETLKLGERLLRIRKAYPLEGDEIVPNYFRLQEKDSMLYQAAKYGVFKFNKEYIWIGLADDKFQIIK